MFKNILQSFLPWILYFILMGESQLRIDIAIVVAALTAIIFELKGLKKGFILSWGTLLFFIFMFIAVLVLRNQWVATHSWLFSNGALAAIAWFSILIRKPFTLQYAREQVSPDKWQHPLFLKINYLLTVVWGLVFLMGMGLHVIKFYFPGLRGAVFEAITYIPSIFAIWFTGWFPGWYRERYIRRIQKQKENKLQ